MKYCLFLFVCIAVGFLAFSCSTESETRDPSSENPVPTESAAAEESKKPAETDQTTETATDQQPAQATAVAQDEIQDDGPQLLKTDRELVEQLVSGFSAATAERQPIEFLSIQAAPNAGLIGENPQFAQTPDTATIPVGELGTAVVAQENVRLYADPGREMNDADLESAEVLATIPPGAVIPLHGKHVGEEWVTWALGQYNYWWITEYDGQRGVVFGAFLDGEGRDPESNLRLAHYYRQDIEARSFYPYTGASVVPSGVIDCLQSDRVAIEAVSPGSYLLSTASPDDMVSLYQRQTEDKLATVFITTDLLIHSLHLVFDKMLADVEEQNLLPMLTVLVEGYLSALTGLDSETAGTETAVSTERMIAYFQVAEGLLRFGQAAGVGEGIPEDVSPWEFDPTISREEEVDRVFVFSPYPKPVQTELELILAAEKREKSPLLGIPTNYPKFKPRGHYTKTDALRTYFRVMSWFGEVHFHFEDNLLDHPEKPNQTADALLLLKVGLENPDLMEIWHALFDPITYLIGESDNLSFEDLLGVLDEASSNAIQEIIDSRESTVEWLQTALPKLRKPLIADRSVWTPESVEQASQGEMPMPPVGFRFFGQRFTYDSMIHQLLSSPRVGSLEAPRNMVKGLDVMAAFGSSSATILLEEESQNVVGFRDNLTALTDFFETRENLFWRGSFYNGYLRLVRALGSFEKGAGHYFTTSDIWDTKTLITAHAGWAELRHDTILYVKQSFAEMGGEGDDITYDRMEPRKPVHFVEPNIEFFQWLVVALSDAGSVLSDTGLLTDLYKSKFSELEGIARDLVDIVAREIKGESITAEQNSGLRILPHRLARIVVPAASTDGFVDEEQLKMALVADVHSTENEALEVATGIPYRIYVLLNDKHGGKRIGVGYMFSYYEFTQPANQRMNDEEWKRIVYSDSSPMDQYLPLWAQGILCGAE